MKKKAFVTGIWLLFAVVAAACSGTVGNGIVMVTPIPEAPPATSVTPIVPSPTPTASLESVSAQPEQPTPTPLSVNLPKGEAAAAAMATDIAHPAITPKAPVAINLSGPNSLTFNEFYDGFDLRHGLILSDKLVALDGQQVNIEGYMAPPLKPELDYFVLTRIRLEFCPFCSTAADWPNDIALVYMVGDPVRVTSNPVAVTGQLEVGPSVDQETGMVSMVRIYANVVEVLN